ncbi:MAG TPA: hypothetical protein VGD40_24495 [Chryseosolibacter sp.]
MIIAAIIFSIVLFPLLWILFMPVNIQVNTQSHLYTIQQTGTVKWSFHPGESPSMKLRILGFPVEINRQAAARKDAREKKRATKSKKMRKSMDAWLNFFSRLVSSFRCKRFVCNIDFDDVVLNAQLFPVGPLLSRGPVVLNVNFERNYLLDIWIQARLHRMLWAFIRFYLTK